MKIIGSRHPHNVIKVIFTALKELNLWFGSLKNYH
ncbi:hypothetical protein [Candidatus Hodgkinia cicadicola]